LPLDIIPEEEDDAVNGARGTKMAIFVHGPGTGPFAEGPTAAGLEVCFKLGTTDAGHVCPVSSVPRLQYEGDLAATRPDWVIDHS